MGDEISLFMDFLNKKLPQADYESYDSDNNHQKTKDSSIRSDLKETLLNKSPKKAQVKDFRKLTRGLSKSKLGTEKRTKLPSIDSVTKGDVSLINHKPTGSSISPKNS